MVRPFVLIFWSQLANASGARVKEANHLFNSDPSETLTSVRSSFGGWKDSFFGDIPMYGPDGLRFWIKRKNVMTRWPDTDAAALSGLNFGAGAG